MPARLLCSVDTDLVVDVDDVGTVPTVVLLVLVEDDEDSVGGGGGGSGDDLSCDCFNASSFSESSVVCGPWTAS